MRVALSLLPLLSLSTILGCKTPPPRTQSVIGPPESGMSLVGQLASRDIISSEAALGVSGSCQEANSASRWLVTERNHMLIEIRDEGERVFPIEGVPEGFDLEGLACDEGRFYISTETQAQNRSQDIVLVADLQGDKAIISGQIELDYPDGLKAGENEGLEGLCISDGWLVASGEVIRSDEQGVRQAPILRKKIGEPETFLHWLELTTRTGKISGIDCRMHRGELEVFGIERHYEVARILQFSLSNEVSKAETILELEHLVRNTENFEAILVDRRGQVRLTNDNQFKTVTGPSEETLLEAVESFSH